MINLSLEPSEYLDGRNVQFEVLSASSNEDGHMFLQFVDGSGYTPFRVTIEEAEAIIAEIQRGVEEGKVARSEATR